MGHGSLKMIWFSPKTDNKMLKLGKMGPMDLLCHFSAAFFLFGIDISSMTILVLLELYHVHSCLPLKT